MTEPRHDPHDPPPWGPAPLQRRYNVELSVWEYTGLTLDEFAERWRAGRYVGRSGRVVSQLGAYVDGELDHPAEPRPG
jgi:hypothetical protein